jgi:hypothetical protein
MFLRETSIHEKHHNERHFQSLLQPLDSYSIVLDFLIVW